MKFLTVASILAITLPTALAGPVPTPTHSINFIARRQEADAPTPTTPPSASEEPVCPFSVTVTASRTCTAPACEEPNFCIAMINLRDFACDCFRQPPTTTTVTPKCPSDCECAVPTSWVVPKGCNPNAPKGVKGPIKVNPSKAP